MSDIWPPRSFSVIDGTFTETYTYKRWDEVLRKDVTHGGGVTSIRGITSRLGANTPNFVEAARTGHLPMWLLKFSESLIRGTTGRKLTMTEPNDGRYALYEKTGAFDVDVSGIGVVFGEISALRTANLENKVKQQVMANLKGQDINLSVDFAERDKTARMIAHAFTRIAKSRRALMSGNFVGAAQALGLSITKKLRMRSKVWSQTRDLSSGWLELQYGWKPLIQSVYGAAAYLSRSHVNSEYRVFHARGSINDTNQERSESTHSRLTIDTSVNMTKKVTLKVRLTSPVLADLQSLGITNPAFTAWELVPFSFVVDWAIPIGSFLSQLDASMGYSFAGASMTTFTKSTYDAADYGPEKPPIGYAKYEVDLHQHAERTGCYRDSIAGFGDLFSLPYFKDPNSNLHVANALALLVATHPKY